VLEELDAVLDETASGMTTLTQGQFAEYRTFESKSAEQEWRGLRWALALFVVLQRRPEPALTLDEVRDIEAIGSLRADQGIPLTAVLGSIRVATYAALRAVGAIARQVAGDEAMACLDRIHFRLTCFINDFPDAISRGYMVRTGERA
jgi:hypothetical protein